MRLSEVKNLTRRQVFKIEDEEVEITYRLNLFTPAIQQRIEAAPDEESNDAILRELVVSIDVTDEDGNLVSPDLVWAELDERSKVTIIDQLIKQSSPKVEPVGS